MPTSIEPEPPAAIAPLPPPVEELTDVQVEAVRQFTRGRLRLRHTRLAPGAWRLLPLDPFEADFALRQLWPILCLLRWQGHVDFREDLTDAMPAVIAHVNALFDNLCLDLHVTSMPVDTQDTLDTLDTVETIGADRGVGRLPVAVTGSPSDLGALTT
jgi:hypothetical protein